MQEDEPQKGLPSEPLPHPPEGMRGIALPENDDRSRVSAPTGRAKRGLRWMMVGGIVALASGFLPFVSADGQGVRNGSASLIGYSAGSPGIFFLAGLAVIEALGAFRHIPVVSRIRPSVWTGGIMAYLVVRMWFDISRAIDVMDPPIGVNVDTGVGLYLATLATLAVLGGALMYRSERAASG